MTYRIKWIEGVKNPSRWTIEFEDWSRAYYYLNKVFSNAELTDDNGAVVGGVRPAREEEKKNRRQKWFRWLINEECAAHEYRYNDAPKTEPDFMMELKKLDEDDSR